MLGISQSGTSVDPFLFALKCRIYNAASIILVNAFCGKSLLIRRYRKACSSILSGMANRRTTRSGSALALAMGISQNLVASCFGGIWRSGASRAVQLAGLSHSPRLLTHTPATGPLDTLAHLGYTYRWFSTSANAILPKRQAFRCQALTWSP